MTRARVLTVAVLALLVVAAGGAAVASAQENLATLTVTVSTPAGDPVQGATLTATWNGGTTSQTTHANGKVFLDVPSGADVEIYLHHPDYVRNFPVTVTDATTRDVSMRAYQKSSLHLSVEDSEGAVSGATVKLQKAGRDVVTDTTGANGAVDSGVIEAGTYTAVVSKPGYYVGRKSVDVGGDTSATATVRQGTVTLEVNVTDDHFDSPRPVVGASVAVEGSGSVTTQPGGIGRISVPVNKWLTLRVTKDGYESSKSSTFVGETDATASLSIQRTPAVSVALLSKRVVAGESVSLSVTDEYGDPVSNATVRLDGDAVANTDAGGAAIIEVPSAGNHTVGVSEGSLSANATVVGVGEASATGTTESTTAGTGAGTGTETSSQLPGFGVLVALLAVALAVAVGLARRSWRP